MALERTFAIIKPDAVERKLAGKILARLEQEGFTVRAIVTVTEPGAMRGSFEVSKGPVSSDTKSQ